MQNNSFNVLFISDIMGAPGCQLVYKLLKKVIHENNITFVVANAETAAEGLGVTPSIAYRLFQAGIDVITSGNHIWHNEDIYPVLEHEYRLLRPLNYTDMAPGKGICFVEKEGITLAVVNLQGRTHMNPVESPFKSLEENLDHIRNRTDYIIVDFHAEFASEKQALGYYFDGKLSALLGTHTHVPTADDRILPGGTAYITDVGMTGAADSVIGYDISDAIYSFLVEIPVKKKVAVENPVFESVIVNIDIDTAKANSLRKLSIKG